MTRVSNIKTHSVFLNFLWTGLEYFFYFYLHTVQRKVLLINGHFVAVAVSTLRVSGLEAVSQLDGFPPGTLISSDRPKNMPWGNWRL